LQDVFILPNYRGQGLGKWLVSTILNHPKLQKVRKWSLNTKDAFGLYERFGFQLHIEQESYMTFKPQDHKLAEAAKMVE
jgi:ribosomal protein S18 acetylase RimI-like enzyme